MYYSYNNSYRQCPVREHLRIPLIYKVAEMDGFQGKSSREQTASILPQTCSKSSISTQCNVVCQIWCVTHCFVIVMD